MSPQDTISPKREMKNRKFKSEEELEYLETVLDMIRAGECSLRNGSEFLEAKTGVKISHEALRKRLKGTTNDGSGD